MGLNGGFYHLGRTPPAATLLDGAERCQTRERGGLMEANASIPAPLLSLLVHATVQRR